ncbi:MAG: helix-turn-helix domain-containing protein [Chloroflexota bacterium]|nr:helix-turn-helix domain-containing protein [Chloroflexota bacterium]
MANRSRPVYEAERLSDRHIAQIGADLRGARIAAGKTLADAGRAIGLSASQVCRIERGLVRGVPYRRLAQFAGAVGLRLSLKSYPGGRRLLDQPQLNLLRDLLARTHPSWKWSTEVPMPIAGDLRAADARSSLATCSVVYELCTRLSDVQGQTRAGLLKKRDLAATCLVMVVRATHANRRALRLAGPGIEVDFPLGTRTVLKALAEGRCPEADGIVLI